MLLSWELIVLAALVVRNPTSINGGGSSGLLDQLNASAPPPEGDDPLPTVIVVGGGLAGLATSLGLANTGKFRVDLVELRPDFSRKGGSFGLAPNGIKALEELDPNGVMSTLYPLGIDSARGIRKAWLFGWWMVRNALLERVRLKSDKIRFHMGYTVQDIVDDPGAAHIQATFRPAPKSQREAAAAATNNQNLVSPAETLTLNGCLLVGADGVHSSIRRYLNDRAQEQKVGVTMWRGRITVDPSNPGNADPSQHELLLPLLQQGIMPLGGIRNYGPTVVVMFNFHSKRPGTLSWTISTKSTDIAAVANVWTAALEPHVDNEDDRKMLQAVLALADPEDVWNPITYCVVKPPTEDGKGWGGTGRVVLIGDAAHALRAATGQGGNMAFEDAVVLCRALTEQQHEDDGSILRSYDHVAALVAKVENERLPRVRKVWNMEQAQAEQNYVNSEVLLLTPEYIQWLYHGV